MTNYEKALAHYSNSMKLLIKQRVFSWTNSYEVYDENEIVKYYVEARLVSLGHHFYVFNKSKNIISMIAPNTFDFYT